MGILIWLIVGGIIGWLASLLMRRDAQQGILLNIVVGIVGSFIGGFLIAPMLGSGTANTGDFSVPGLLASLGGAIVLLLIVNLITRGRAR
jgi:uncharacterized membrane protein YeaQ/YmgE (transglycosylase-associated protein family)